ncbi:MAG: 3D-(3,5/4)-trihydroxycyclohexane-1,2-dione acylhydrolase (decyclizing), partial [Solirubrobacteraceae bacterium]
ASIGALSRSLGSAGFGTHYRFAANGSLPVDDAAGTGLARPAGSDVLPIDLAANAESLGARVIRARTIADLRAALPAAGGAGGGGVPGPTVVCIETDRYAGVPSYDGWWDVPVAQTSEQDTVRAARAQYERDVRTQRQFL